MFLQKGGQIKPKVSYLALKYLPNHFHPKNGVLNHTFSKKKQYIFYFWGLKYMVQERIIMVQSFEKFAVMKFELGEDPLYFPFQLIFW